LCGLLLLPGYMRGGIITARILQWIWQHFTSAHFSIAANGKFNRYLSPIEWKLGCRVALKCFCVICWHGRSDSVLVVHCTSTRPMHMARKGVCKLTLQKFEILVTFPCHQARYGLALGQVCMAPPKVRIYYPKVCIWRRWRLGQISIAANGNFNRYLTPYHLEPMDMKILLGSITITIVGPTGRDAVSCLFCGFKILIRRPLICQKWKKGTKPYFPNFF
jgi:hypothetical protein